MTTSSARSPRRWFKVAAALVTALVVGWAQDSAALVICNDYDGVPSRLDTVYFSEVGSTVSTYALNGGRLFDEGGGALVNDLDVMIRLTHPNVSDLQIWLRHTTYKESGAEDSIITIPLTAYDGCYDFDYPQETLFNQDMSLYFDDDSVASVDFACERSVPALSGRVSPSTAKIIDVFADPAIRKSGNGFASFNGRPVAGGSKWELVILDSGDSGESAGLVEWCMIFNDQEEGDVAPREETATISDSQYGNGIISISDYIGTGLTLLGYLNPDFRVFEPVTGPTVEAKRMFLNLAEFAGMSTPDVSGIVNGASGETIPVSIFLNDDFFENVRRGAGVEFSLLDTAPGMSGGDGLLTVADWVQTTRYAAGAGFDQPVKGSGPLSPSDRIVSLGNTVIPRGLQVEIPVYMRTKGIEHEVATGVTFDPEVLRFDRAEKGDCLPPNATFQLSNEADANANGSFGLQIGLLPDQTFVCDYRTPPDVLVSNGTALDDVSISDQGTAPASLLYEVQTTVESIDFTTDPARPRVTVGVYVDNPVLDPISDYTFDMEYDFTRLQFVSATEDAAFNASSSATLGAFRFGSEYSYAVQQISNSSDTSTFVSGKLVELTFDVIVGNQIDPDTGLEVLDANEQPISSANECYMALRKGSRTVFNSLKFGDQTPFFRARFDNAVTTPIKSRATVRVVDGSGNAITNDCLSVDEQDLYVEVTNNIRTLTSYGFNLRYDSRRLQFVGIDLPSASGPPRFEVAPDPPDPIITPGSIAYVGVGVGYDQSVFLNGRLIKATFVRTSAADDHTVSVVGTPAIYSGEFGIPCNPYEYFGFDCDNSGAIDKSLLVADEAVSTDSDDKIVQTGPEVRTRIAAIAGTIGSPELTIEVNTSNVDAGTPITDYAFMLSYDTTILELFESTSASGPAPVVFDYTVPFDEQPAGVQTALNNSDYLMGVFDYYHNVYHEDLAGNYGSFVLAGSDSTSTATNGTLVQLKFRASGQPVTAPSIFLTERPPVNEKVRIAKLYFTALPGDGAVVTPLQFAQDPITFIAPTVRNVAGVPVYASFADAGVTVIDNADRRPTVRVLDTVLANLTPGTIQIVLDSVGVENSVGFTMEFDPAFLKIQQAAAGRDIPADGFFFTYPNVSDIDKANTTGKLAILLGLQPGQTFEEGTRVIANLFVEPLVDSPDTQESIVHLTPLYDRAEVVDPNGVPVVTRFPDSTISVAGSDCSYEIVPNDLGGGYDAEFTTNGGGGQFDLVAPSGCPWTAITNTDWITIESGASGQGDGTIVYTVSPNSGEERSGSIEIVGQTFDIYQEGCDFTMFPDNQTFASEGGTGTFEVTTTESCPWVATSNASWILITSKGFGTGTDTVSYLVERNVGLPRTGTITISMPGVSKDYTVDQEICRYQLDPTETNDVPVIGGDFSFEVTARAGSSTAPICPWTAETDSDWIIISPDSAQGRGDGTVSFSVEPNVADVRVGTITVAGETHVVHQLGVTECDYAISPERLTYSALGGVGEFSLSTTDECPWEVKTDNDWISITSSTTGSGNTTVNYFVDANTDVTRVGQIKVADQIHEVQQFGGNEFIFEFRENPEGWTFETVNPPFTEPTGAWNSGSAERPGRLDITTADNTNTFGFWRSPVISLVSAATPEDLYEVILELSSTVPGVDAPESRFRVSSADFFRSDVFVANSNGNGGFAPTAMGRPYRQLIELPANTTSFRAYFDVLNFDSYQAVADATNSLERVLIRRVEPSRLSDPQVEEHYILASDSDAAAWTSATALPLHPPIFSASDRGLVIASGFTSQSGAPEVFGFWNLVTDLRYQSSRIYKATFIVSARSELALPVRKSLVPTFRMRMNSTSLKNSAYVNIESISDDSPVPTFLERQSYDLWFAAPPELLSDKLIFSFDYLYTPGSFNDPSISLILEEMTLTSYLLSDPVEE